MSKTAPQHEEQLDEASAQDYTLRLYVTGTSPHSTRAVLNVKNLCERFLQGHYDLEVIDVYQQGTLAGSDQAFVTPMLVRTCPLPSRRITGDLSNTNYVMSQ